MEIPKEHSEGPNHLWKGFWTLFFAAALITSFPMLQSRVPFLKENMRPYSLLDSIVVQAPEPVKDTLKAMIDSLQKSGKPSKTLDSLLEVKAYTGGPGLENYFTALQAFKEKKKKLRIAYFGDSMIEGDLVTQTLREQLQAAHGGEGVGFVPIKSQTSNFRVTIRHQYSKDWEYGTFIAPKKAKGGKVDTTGFDWGISGEYFYLPNRTGTVNYQGSKSKGKNAEFHEIYLFYGRDSKDSSGKSVNKVTIRVNEKDSTYVLDGKSRVNILKVFSGKTTEMSASFDIAPHLPVFGFSFESKEGAHVDNFAVRGNSGLPITSVSSQVLAEFNRHMDYDLIILHYGLNVVAKENDSADYGWYKAGYRRMVEYVKTCFPRAAVLVVGMSDMAGKVKGKLQTYPGVPIVNNIQREVAISQQTGFFNLYEKMGGEGSMIKWANELKLAGDDYTHPNGSGARQIGKWIYEFLAAEEKKFHEQKSVVKAPAEDKEEKKVEKKVEADKPKEVNDDKAPD